MCIWSDPVENLSMIKHHRNHVHQQRVLALSTRKEFGPNGTIAVLVFAEYVTFGINPQCEVNVVAFTVAFPAIVFVLRVS